VVYSLSVDAGFIPVPALRANSVSPVVSETTIAPHVPFFTLEPRSSASRPASRTSALEWLASTEDATSCRKFPGTWALPDEVAKASTLVAVKVWWTARL
jgi:hypothetical protein